MPTLVYGETRINTTISSWQSDASITSLADGGYLVTWADPATETTDHIFTQRYNASGVKAGGETRINATLSWQQEDPVVTVLANGSYVLAWKAEDDLGNRDIRTQLFSSNGTKIGAESYANTYRTGQQDSPEVTALKDGGYVVSWTSDGQDGSDWGAYLQRYDASGARVGGEVRIGTTTSGAQDGPTVTGLADGGYLAAWEGNGSGDASGIFAQRFNASGTKVGGETRVNTTTVNDQTDPAVTVLKSGGYVVTWQTNLPDNDGNEDTEGPGDIYSQLYNASGVKVGGETRVNTTTSGDQGEPRVAALSDGGYLVVWHGNGAGDADGIFVQRFNASGTKVGIETRINTTTAGRQEFANIATLADGGYVITWESYDASGRNPDIHSQRFDANGNKVSGLTGDALANTLTWSGANSVIIDAGAGNDILTGGVRNDHLNGGAGNDSLNGGQGADRMTGGDGSDVYYVDNIGDIVSETNATMATGGTDTIYSYLASYTLGSNIEDLRLMSSGAANGTGNALNNLIQAGAGNNVLNGGSGSDALSYASATAAVTANLGVTTAQATGGSGVDTLLNFEHLTGSNYHDRLTGNALANTLTGGAGNDNLNGGAGNDMLIGGTGTDTLFGGTGADRFDFNAIGETGLGVLRDVIADFKAAEGDKIDLSTLDANGQTALNDAFSFIGANAFSVNATGQLRFANGVILGSTDADSAAEFEIALVGVTSLGITDVIL
ncbi:calcium-binding protein [Pseudomonas sp. JM0905a]|uniref:calcium-binding protein n=1 Tax=Pseudomonas sp. JM0905a TaxID=2772484 RepID=UPI001685B30D|nr:calcium-binding protein [Pseudomonas sp. JM0905a]MBD2840320.1 calcium-binding protein [Pseudomonas sp. JM0905a]